MRESNTQMKISSTEEQTTQVIASAFRLWPQTSKDEFAVEGTASEASVNIPFL